KKMTKKKKWLIAIVLIATLLGSFGYYMITKKAKIIPYYSQLTMNYVENNKDVQPKAQKTAAYVGSTKCGECHKDNHKAWQSSNHSKIIQSIKDRPSSVIADFGKLPADADFNKSDAVYTIGGKFKQRYMIEKDGDYRIGNYQWNTQLGKWQPFAAYKDWYMGGFENNNTAVPTGKTCDGCHFTGYMSKEQRVEPAIACESCHGPGSAHAKAPKEPNIYRATMSDPRKATEVCLQCHMRNRDKRLDNNMSAIKDLFGDVRDYPKGYEPGKALINYKTPAPFEHGKETGEFYGNGVGKKNRTQGNEYVKSRMYAHGITCVNCHNPHKLDNTAQKPLGDESCMKCHETGSVVGPHAINIEAHTKHKVGSKGSSCIECHMPKTGKHLDNSPLTVRTHIFGFITPMESKKYGVANACNNCHKDKSVDWAIDVTNKWGMNGGWDKR
ncbi:MAG TPA: multiheme c-type cytochrome, partial [Campylobacterales bacterium]|nr:multiheme c-type cytochrome [Campylobacterales bacterium]